MFEAIAFADTALDALLIAATALVSIAATLTIVGRRSAPAKADPLANLGPLRAAFDAMPEGVAYFDAQDRLVAWNAPYAELCAYCGTTAAVGLSLSQILERAIAVGAQPDATGQEEAWVAERTSARDPAGQSVFQRLGDGRWLRVEKRGTANGGTISVCVDVTELKTAEAAMAEARDRAEELARRAEAAESVAGLGHWRMEARTQEITWSAELYRIYGLDPALPLDLDAVMRMTHPEDLAAAAARIGQMLAGQPAEHSTTRIVREDGQVRYLDGASQVERGPGGEIVAAIGTTIDVTERKLAEIAVGKSEERFRRLAVNAPDMIAESRLDGVMTYVSPASAAITGFTPEELVGRPFASLMEAEDAAKVRAMCQAVFASKGAVAPWPVEFRARHKDGTALWLECKPTFFVDPASGVFTGLTDVIRDVTQRKALETQLEAARAEAEAAAAVKGEFLANMSHELRTPLTSIIGFTGLAAEQRELSDLSRAYVARVSDASRALLSTVNDILDFSKLEAGQVTLHPKPSRLAGLCRATLELLAPQAGAKDLDLVFDNVAGDDLALLIDPDRVRQVLLNFVGNAVKFTETGRVTLRTAYSLGALTIEVSDTGPGIAADKLGVLFQRFSQIDGSLTRSQGGTGLGLAICKGLVEAMGGQVGVDSRPGQGSRFWFTIPAPTAAPEAAATNEGPGAAGRADFEGLRVLVVDDHATNRELARLMLAGIGAEVTEAVDGEDACERAAEWPFDAILMDLRMPKLDGLGALARIRGTEGPNDQTPILAFTADVTAELTARLTEAGFDAVVAKPMDPAALTDAIAAATAPPHYDKLEEQAHVA